MATRWIRLLTVAYCLLISPSLIIAQNRWATARPEEVGVDSNALADMFAYIREHKLPVHSVQIVRRNRLVLDAYLYPYNATMRHDVASVTKSITSTLVGLAIAQGRLPDVHQRAIALLNQNAAIDSDKITLEDLLTMRSGWDCGVDMSDPRINVDDRLAAMRSTTDWLTYILNLPMTANPGTRFAYCNANCHLLSIVLSRVTGINELSFARRYLFSPLGINDVYWPIDPQGNNYGWSDLQLRPLDMAKFGQLMLQRGRWNLRVIVPQIWIDVATSPHVKDTGNRDSYGYLWWIADHPEVFEAVGRGGQRITIWPAKDLVIVFTGGGFDTSELSQFLLRAVESDKSLPPNPQAAKRLRNEIARAKLPPRAIDSQLPALAHAISDKTFRLGANSLGLSELTLSFKSSHEAEVYLKWYGRSVNCRLGLDGVERFSRNPLVRLPQAATGKWLDEDTFLFKLDLVGAINCYFFKIHFLKNRTQVAVEVNERTGLNNEQFSGEIVDHSRNLPDD